MYHMNIIHNQRQLALRPRKRGVALTLFILFQLAINAFGLLMYFVAGRVFLGHLPAWIVILDLITFMGSTIGLVATLRWKRIGAYSVLAFYLLKSFENVLLGTNFGAVLPLGYAAIFVLLLRSHWNDLD